MSQITEKSAQAIQINAMWGAPDTDQVVLTDTDGDRAVYTVNDVIDTMRSKEVEEFGKERLRSICSDVFARAGAWIKQHATAIKGGYITDRDGDLLLVIVQSALEYDEPLHDHLLDWECDMARNEDIRPVVIRTLLLPHIDADQLASFLSRDLTLMYKSRDRA